MIHNTTTAPSHRSQRQGYLLRSNGLSIPRHRRPGSRRRPKGGGSRLARVDGDSSSRWARLSRSVAFRTTDPASSRPSCQRHGSTPSIVTDESPRRSEAPMRHLPRVTKERAHPSGPTGRGTPGQDRSFAKLLSSAGRPDRRTGPCPDPRSTDRCLRGDDCRRNCINRPELGETTGLDHLQRQRQHHPIQRTPARHRTH